MAARVHGAFQLMREAEAEWRARTAARGAAPAEPGELARVHRPLRDAFMARLQAAVRDEDFAALAQARFSEAAERELARLATRGLEGNVVEELDLLSAERGRGMAVRNLRAGSVQRERAMADLSAVRDVSGARADVEGAAAGLPRGTPPRLRLALARVAAALVRPTLTLNEAETQRRRRDSAEHVKPTVIRLRRGERIIGDGEQIEARHLVIFRAIRAQTRERDLAGVRLGGGALVGLALLVLWRYARRNVHGFAPSRKDALLLAILFLGNTALASLGLAAGDALHDRFPGLAAEAFYYLVPFAAGAMLVRSVLSTEIALLFSMAGGAVVGLVAGHSIFFAAQAALTSVAASGRAGRPRDRSGLFRAGLRVGGLGALLAVATHLFIGRVGIGSPSQASLLEVGASAAAAFLSGALLLPVLVAGLLPLLELVFGYVTEMRLLELANLNHPALKELIVQAPGTYHHSIVMGTLVESAAQAIGANPVLAKVCAYYHDIGKCRNPLYFAENQRGESKHDTLAPSMSALIVKRHVTDGLELAAHWRLPRPVVDAIAQHHGTRLVSFFWAKAQRAAGEATAPGSGSPPSAEEGLYRYPGPRPQTREAALVMIADACEASVRSLADPVPERIGALVQRRVNEIFSEGQLDECDLTLKDLNAIAGAMVRVLEGLHHARPDYPARPPSEETPSGVHLVVRGQG
jgi:putative nucleotidyltransferase with HDIG domain